MTRALPYLMGGLSLGASIGYFATGDWRHGVYWLCASGIAVVVTVM